MQKANLRHWPRHSKLYLVQYAASLKDGFLPATVVNFSRGGLCLMCGSAQENGARLTIKLTQELAGLAREVRGKVKWCVPARTGGFAVGVEYEEPLRWTKYD